MTGTAPEGRSSLSAIFAPDWRDGVAYQRLLAEALAAHGVRVTFLRNYRRGLPLWRLTRPLRDEVLHLHWPEAYFPAKGDRLDWLRSARFPLDLALAARGRALVVTAHNEHAHNRGGDSLAVQAARSALRQAQIVIAHSEAAARKLSAAHDVEPRRIRVIPHGDLSVTLGPPLPRDAAREILGLPAIQKVCLMFGVVEPYKGIEEVLAHWQRARPDTLLVIAGRPHTPEYGEAIRRAAAGAPNVRLHSQWLADADLRCWLSAADCVLFNYRTIFTSGAASLARSFGVPLLLPARLDTVDLGEPHPLVWRFSDFGAGFSPALAAATAAGSDFDAAAPWRSATAWDRVARETAAAYREALGA